MGGAGQENRPVAESDGDSQPRNALFKLPLPRRILGGLLSAITIIGLLDSISLVKLQGQLAQWFEAYSGVVEWARKELITYLQMPRGIDGNSGITSLEAHIVAVVLVLSTSMIRSVWTEVSSDARAEILSGNLKNHWPEVIILGIVYYIFHIFFCIFLPCLMAILTFFVMWAFTQWWSLAVYGFICINIVGVTYLSRSPESDDEFISPRGMRREINVVVGWVVVILVLNHTVLGLN